jgi:hypothetical protein
MHWPCCNVNAGVCVCLVTPPQLTFQNSLAAHVFCDCRWSSGQADYRARLDPIQQRLLRALPSFPYHLDPLPLHPIKFQAIAHDVAAFVREHGRMPTERQGVTPNERKLANAVVDLKGRKSNHGQLSAEQVRVMEAIPGWEWAAARKLGRKKGVVNVPRSYVKFVEELKAREGGQQVAVKWYEL